MADICVSRARARAKSKRKNERKKETNDYREEVKLEPHGEDGRYKVCRRRNRAVHAIPHHALRMQVMAGERHNGSVYAGNALRA